MITKADLDDQRWLDQRIDDVENGIEAVLDIYRNWTENRNLSRLHRDDAFAYIKGHVVQFSLGRKDVPALIEGTNLSFSAIAQLTGAGIATVLRDAEVIQTDNPDEPRVGTDGKPAKGGRPRKPKPVEPPVLEGVIEEVIEPKAPPEIAYWADLVQILDLIESLLVNADAPTVAATVPLRRRAASAKRLRKLGTYLGGIAWSLERNGGSS